MRNFNGVNFKIDRLKVADFKSARDIFTSTFQTTPVSDFQYAWKYRVPCSYGIFTEEGDLVGFILCHVGGYKYNNTHIKFLAVHPLYQKYRLGSSLLETLLKKECDMRRNVTLTPVYTPHVWHWYHRIGFYVTKYAKAEGGGVFTLMNFHYYPTRRNNHNLWFPSMIPVGNQSNHYVE